jgi:hypothetical protein
MRKPDYLRAAHAVAAAAAILTALCRATNSLSTLGAVQLLGIHLLPLVVAAGDGVAAPLPTAQPANDLLLDLASQNLSCFAVEVIAVSHKGFGLIQ